MPGFSKCSEDDLKVKFSLMALSTPLDFKSAGWHKVFCAFLLQMALGRFPYPTVSTIIFIFFLNLLCFVAVVVVLFFFPVFNVNQSFCRGAKLFQCSSLSLVFNNIQSFSNIMLQCSFHQFTYNCFTGKSWRRWNLSGKLFVLYNYIQCFFYMLCWKVNSDKLELRKKQLCFNVKPKSVTECCFTYYLCFTIPFIFQPIALLQCIVHEVSQIYLALPLFLGT